MHRIEMTIESEPKRPNTYPNTTSPIFSASKFPFETQTERGPKDQSWMGIGTGDWKSYMAKKGSIIQNTRNGHDVMNIQFEKGLETLG